MKLIAIVGRAGSGKSTIADALVRVHGFQRTAFAAALKAEVASTLRISRLGGSLPSDITDLMQLLRNDGDVNPFRKPTSANMRKLLQWWGTEYRRAKDSSYWLRQLDLASWEVDDKIVIDDCRFQNEADFVRALGGEVWAVTGRQAEGIPQHASETEQDAIAADKLILNFGTLDDLYASIEQALNNDN